MSLSIPDFKLIDINVLLQPIPGPNPAGESLFYDVVYSDIREARRFDDFRAPNNPFEIKKADWKKVVALTTHAFSHRSKDLQLAVWLTEALVRLHGFPGLSEGIGFLTTVIDRYWDLIFPLPEGQDLEARANVLNFLNGPSMALAIREIPLLPNEQENNYSYEQWEQSKGYVIPDNLESLDDEEKKYYERLQEEAKRCGIPSQKQWEIFETRIKPEHIRPTNQQIMCCLEEIQILDQVITKRFREQGISFQKLSSLLEAIQLLVKRFQKDISLKAEGVQSDHPGIQPEYPTFPAGTEAEPIQTTSHQGEAQMVGSAGKSQMAKTLNRKEALAQLARLAEFFRKTEPHSPVSYLVHRAVKWGESPLGDVLGELIKDQNVLDHVRETLGIQVTTD